ncbi:hypothetical protein T492DRAFT_209837 [Pavlovales sp. CCMP2436]|nr:hypothetical protein T492DRAFT_209837 [Pavlovales sp. CCMP2436]
MIYLAVLSPIAYPPLPCHPSGSHRWLFLFIAYLYPSTHPLIPAPNTHAPSQPLTIIPLAPRCRLSTHKWRFLFIFLLHIYTHTRILSSPLPSLKFTACSPVPPSPPFTTHLHAHSPLSIIGMI